ncbi:MAG: DUF3467 domain-containing protein [bacterium]|nr:DUF3467 domain-containing protein [bacterium]MCY4257257.1 DUF3467 domain-containing protein [bacterium]
MPEDPEQIDLQILADPEMRGGVWANFAIVKHSEHEFTIDFCRLDYDTSPLSGVLVQRVNMSPLFVNQLIHALGDNLDKYATAMPDGLVIPDGDDHE